MMRMRPIAAETMPAEASFDLLRAGIEALQAATPTARAAGELDRARLRLSGLALLHPAAVQDGNGEAWRRGRFHRLAGAAGGKPR